MRLRMIITADHANIDSATGKLNILGAFTQIYTSGVPARHPAMVIIVGVSVEPVDPTDEQNLAIVMTDEDGIELMKISGPLQIPINEDGTRPDANFLTEIRNIIFPHLGTYDFTAYVNDQNIGYTQITVMSLPK